MTEADEADLFNAAADAARKLFSRNDGVVTADLLEAMGWDELYDADPATAISVMAEEQGRAVGRSPVLERSMLTAGGTKAPDVTVVLPWGRPECGESDEEIVELFGIVVSPETIAPRLVAPLSLSGELAWWSLPTASVRCESVTGIDPTAGWARISGRVRLCDLDRVDQVAWVQSEAIGQLVTAHELVGLSAELVSLACDHVRQRYQFGVPLGTLQAVQHRLAEAHVETASTRAVLATAWVNRGQIETATALLWARRAFLLSVEQCGQVMGAMGCTWEHRAHTLIRRGSLLSQLFAPQQVSGAASWVRDLVAPDVDVLESSS